MEEVAVVVAVLEPSLLEPIEHVIDVLRLVRPQIVITVRDGDGVRLDRPLLRVPPHQEELPAAARRLLPLAPHQAEHVDDMLNWFKQRGFKNRHHHRDLFHKQETAYDEAKKQKATNDAQNDAGDEQAEVIQEVQFVDDVSALGAST